MVLTQEGTVQKLPSPFYSVFIAGSSWGPVADQSAFFMSLEVIPRLRHFHRDLYLTPGLVMDVERLDILGNIIQNRVTDPQ